MNSKSKRLHCIMIILYLYTAGYPEVKINRNCHYFEATLYIYVVYLRCISTLYIYVVYLRCISMGFCINAAFMSQLIKLILFSYISYHYLGGFALIFDYL